MFHQGLYQHQQTLFHLPDLYGNNNVVVAFEYASMIQEKIPWIHLMLLKMKLKKEMFYLLQYLKTILIHKNVIRCHKYP